jgi:hypothetical protein
MVSAIFYYMIADSKLALNETDICHWLHSAINYCSQL